MLQILKKAVAIFVLFLYLLGVFQVSLSFHYCGKHFKYVSLSEGVEKKSCCKGKMKMHGCCTDKEVAFDLDDDQVSGSKYIIASKTQETDVIQTFYQYPKVLTYPVFDVYEVSHSPPLVFNAKRNILYCTYLI